MSNQTIGNFPWKQESKQKFKKRYVIVPLCILILFGIIIAVQNIETKDGRNLEKFVYAFEKNYSNDENWEFDAAFMKNYYDEIETVYTSDGVIRLYHYMEGSKLECTIYEYPSKSALNKAVRENAIIAQHSAYSFNGRFMLENHGSMEYDYFFKSLKE